MDRHLHFRISHLLWLFEFPNGTDRMCKQIAAKAQPDTALHLDSRDAELYRSCFALIAAMGQKVINGLCALISTRSK